MADPSPGTMPVHPVTAYADPANHATADNGKSSKTFGARVMTLLWDSDYYDKSDAERRLVHKMDCGILSCIAFGYLMKFIDQTNLNNAYVSGMREDLNFKGDELTYLIVMYNAVYCVMQIPSNILALKIRPSWLLGGCELGWMAFTFAQAGATSINQLYAFRFFVAFFEAPFQPAAILLMGSWYTPPELGKRIAIWLLSGTAGQAFSGFMQAAIYKTLDGVAGLPGWRWLYIICGLMTFPCGMACLFFLPDYPATTKVFYLTEAEKEMAQKRCALAGTKPATGIINLATFKRILKKWHFWLLVPTYIVYAWAYFNTYLLLSGYSVTDRNVLPSTAFTIGIPIQFLWGYLSDRYRTRIGLLIGPMLFGLIPTGILAFWAPSKSARLFAFMVDETYFVTHIFFAWVNEICRGDAEERAFMIAAANTGFFAVNAWLPTLVFRQTQGPRWNKGFPTLFAAAIISIFLFLTIWYMQRTRPHVDPDFEGEDARQQGVVETITEQPDEKV